MSSSSNEQSSYEITPDLLARLHQVVRNAGRSDIRSVPALIGKMIGNQNAAIMCLRLLYRFPRSRKARRMGLQVLP